MREELIKAIEENRLTEFVIDNYGDMPTKIVRRLLILLAEYFMEFDGEYNAEIIEDIKRFYHEDFE